MSSPGRAARASRPSPALWRSRWPPGGRRVLLTEVEGRQGIAQLFDCPPLPYEERKVASAPGGGEVYALAIDPEDALLDYLELFYGMKRAGRALKRFGVVDFATTIAPGMRDVLLTGKVKEAVTRNAKRDRNKLIYDAVVHGRAADRPDHPLPERDGRGARARQDRTGTRSGRERDRAAEVQADRGARRDDPRGDAGPGDPRRGRGAARRGAAGRRGRGQHGAHPAARRRRLKRPRSPASWTRACSPPGSSGRRTR